MNAQPSISAQMGNPTHVERIVQVRSGWVPLNADNDFE